MRDVRERLQDILDAIEHVERYAARGRGSFDSDELIQTWVVHHLQVIGEAAVGVGTDFHRAHPEVPWAQIVALRNILVHEYFGIDLEEVWTTVERDLPQLKTHVRAMLSRESSQPKSVPSGVDEPD